MQYQFINIAAAWLIWAPYMSVVAYQARNCSALKNSLIFTGINATILDAESVEANQTTTLQVTSPAQFNICSSYSALPEIPVCRVAINVTTSERSSTYVEVWLPNSEQIPWNGRLVSVANNGINGCVDFPNLAYASSMGFATTGDNGGHDGEFADGTPFLNSPEVVIDFAWRARHSSAVAGKQVIEAFYGRSQMKAYHYGCSTGGRQGLKAVQDFPEDYDGVVAGAAAADLNHLTGWMSSLVTITGVNASDPRFLSYPQWQSVTEEVYRQCDLLDGVADGIIEDASICNFNPELLLCARQHPQAECLTTAQAKTVRAVLSPFTGLNGTFLYPRLSPGAETGAAAGRFASLNGTTNTLGSAFYRNAILADPSYDPTTFSALDVELADSMDAQYGYISSFNGNISAFRDRGGKLITYHGFTDPVIPAENSMRYYRHVAETLNASNTELDDFYRFFRISGMDHCYGGRGGWEFGQHSRARNGLHNILWDLVDWVENGTAPELIVGTKFVNDTPAAGVQFERPHCRYPYRTTYAGGDPNAPSSWNCTYIQDWDRCGGACGNLPVLC